MHGDLGVPVHNRVVEEPKRDIDTVIIPGLLMVETTALEQEVRQECAIRIAPVQFVVVGLSGAVGTHAR